MVELNIPKQRNLQVYADFAMEILDDLKIPYKKPQTFTVNYRARRWGQCRLRNGEYYININRTLLDTRNSEDGLVNTLLHELLHTCPGCMDHGARWKKYAAMVYSKYGYNVKRTSDEEEKGVTTGNFNRKETDYKYLIYCEKCGKLVASRKRRCDLTENPGLYRHGDPCRGKLYCRNAESYIAADNNK